jgi:hypothetical protein
MHSRKEGISIGTLENTSTQEVDRKMMKMLGK